MMRKPLFLAALLPAILGIALWSAPIELGLAGPLLRAYTLAFLLFGLVWFTSRGLQRFLWRVSRRLAFSYFLIGIVPILLVLLLTVISAYVVTGFYVSHLFRDGLISLATDLQAGADQRLSQLALRRLPRAAGPVATRFAYYRDGKRVAGDRSAPGRWQDWWPTLPGGDGTFTNPTMVADDDRTPTLLATATRGRYGVLAVFDGDLSRELSRRSGVWVELLRADDPRKQGAMTFTVFDREYPIKPLRSSSTREELEDFLHPGVEAPGWLDRPTVIWVDVWQPFFDSATGLSASEYVSATLTANLRTVKDSLLSRSGEVGNWVYLLLIGVAFLLFDIWVIALLMAVLMILGLSRAVNRLTEATERVQRGDFQARIEVRRRDQIGALQASFNAMAGNLEDLVAQAAEKEILEKDLEIAQELQQSLLPDTLKAPSALQFETYFEPSSAIGGDYYDLLPMCDGRLAVVVADVSGHGISAGLRMAMVKSALQVLCEKEETPQEILRHLHRLLRSSFRRGQQRGFVTATLTLVDSERGTLEVTNAGHTPTYLLRDGSVQEILLPSPPLGAFNDELGQAQMELEAGDVVVWLSDGLIEAQNGSGDFGYERVVQTLAGLDPDPAAVKRRLLEAIAEHTGGLPPEDDRTLVVMGYRSEPADSERSGSDRSGPAT